MVNKKETLNWSNNEKTWFNIGISFDKDNNPVFETMSYNSVLYRNPKLKEFETKLLDFLSSLEPKKEQKDDDFDNYPDNMEFC